MNPIEHPTHNFKYLGPTPDIGDLPCQRTKDEDGVSAVYSHWKPTSVELHMLNQGAAVRLGIHGIEPIPPVSLAVEEEI